jgi:amidohydrolase
MKTGVLAELTGAKPGPTVAVRSDIDALPIHEQTGLKFRSKTDGCMHACGHDMHMATVLGVAAVLSDLKGDLTGTVRFIFQPAEELPPGGARPLIENGALAGVSMIFGLHVDPHLATGRIGLRDGPTMGSVMDFDLIVKGKGGHAARPHAAVDAITAAAEVIESVQKVVSRENDPMDPVVVTFGSIAGGVARNVVADRVTIKGTARALRVPLVRRLSRLIKRTAAAVCRAHGAKLDMQTVAGYPALINNPRVNRIIGRNFEALYGSGKIAPTDAVLGGEDFACYLELVPGAMFRLGVQNKRIKAVEPWHSPRFIADEAALEIGTAVIAASVLDALTGSGK